MKHEPYPSNELAPARRALYLLSPNTHRITSDTTRLIIEPDQHPPRPFPFNRINRIVSGSATQWRGSAIAACLSRDIPIIWLDPRNQPIGDAHPLHREGGSLHHSIQNYIDLPDWNSRYANWLKSRRMDILHHLLQQRIHSNAEHERYTREYVYQQRLQTRPPNSIRAACQSIVNQHLAEQHTRTRYWGYSGLPMEIASDLAELLAHEYHLSHPLPPKESSQHIQHFEHWWKTEQARFQHHLNELCKHLNSENEKWL